MLLLEQGVRPLQGLEAFHLTRSRRLDRFRHRDAPAEDAVLGLFPPPRQHERVDLQGVGDGLDLHAFQLTEFDRLEFELQAVLSDLRRPETTRHGHLLC